jgi:hypothetical protein
MDNVVPLFDPDGILRGKARDAAMASYRAAVEELVERSTQETFSACLRLVPRGCEGLSILDAVPIIEAAMRDAVNTLPRMC